MVKLLALQTNVFIITTKHYNNMIRNTCLKYQTAYSVLYS